MTDRQLAEKMAEALEKALIPIACFQITDKQRPYTEIGPDMRTALNGAHDSIVEALAAFREAGKEPKYRMLEVGRDCIQEGDEYKDDDGGWRPVPPIFFRMPYTRIHTPTRRPLTNHIPDAKEMVAGHFVDANKKAECEACKGRGWLPIAEGSAVCEKCEGRGET